MKMSFKLPFQTFPGIFSSIDSYTKRLAHSYYEGHGRLPTWFGVQGVPVRVPSHLEFRAYIPDRKILLTGVPDEIFRFPDGSHLIIDYKTARYTDTQDYLRPMYEVQLNGYAYLAEQIGIRPVSGLRLVYFEPEVDIDSSSVQQLILRNGFSMKFTKKVVKVPLRSSLVLGLADEARKIFDSKSAPDGKSGCQNCALLHDLSLIL